MSRRRHLARAPIQEALIDVQFAPIRDGVLDHVVSQVAGDNAASARDIWEQLLEFKVEPAVQPQARATGSAVGKRIDLIDQQQVLQLRSSGFTFSQLPQYKSWEAMSEPALRYWRQFVEATGLGPVNRTAVRYINKVELPIPLLDFEEYLVAAPRIPAALPQHIASFLSRTISVRDADTAIVTQALEGETPDGKAVRVVVDIDIFCRTSFASNDFDTLQATLTRLREFKNDVFFEYLTEKTLEMYE